MKRRAILALYTALALFVGCDDDGGGEDNGRDDGGGVDQVDGTTGGQDGGVVGEGDLPELQGEVDRQSYFPVPGNAVYRYRKKAADHTDPGPIVDGSEVSYAAGEGENEVIRTSVLLLDGEIDDEPARIRQTIEETLVVSPPDELVGPRVAFKGIRIEEREVGTDRFVRVLERTYLPAYPLIEDAWKVGLIFTDINDSMTRMTERLTLRGMEEPMESTGLIDLSVKTVPVGETGAILTMECDFREDVREIQVFDDFSGLQTRTYWVQQGVGPIQWQFRDTSTFTLVESNVAPGFSKCAAE